MQQILTLISLQPSSNIISNTFPQSNLLGIALNVISFSNSISRIVDYGATKHIVYSPSFISYITSHCFQTFNCQMVQKHPQLTLESFI